MEILGELERLVDDVYPFRWVVVGSIAVSGLAFVIFALNRGWHSFVWRRRWRAALIALPTLAVMIPLGYILLSPLWTRTMLEEASPLIAITPPAASGAESPTLAAPLASQTVGASVQPQTTGTLTSPEDPPVSPTSDQKTAAATGSSGRAAPTPKAPTDSGTAASVTSQAAPVASLGPLPSPSPFVARVAHRGQFQGADDFHFGSGAALLIETEPGVFVLRLEDFSVRNGPDLRVYLSTAPDALGDGSLQLGALKATDGSFNYDVPEGVNVSRYQSIVIWCEPFAVLFAVAPLSPA